jgi:hypothetical protein
VAALLACALAVAAVMFAARAARRGRALGGEVERLSARVRALSDALEDVRGRRGEAPSDEPPAPPPGEGSEPGGRRTVH